MASRAKYTEFGSSVSALLTERGLTQNHLAHSINKSPEYLNKTLTGAKTATASWADIVANALNLPPEERVKLHRAAGQDLLRAKGYKLTLDLTKP
jgi:hypothetical protein